MWSHPVLQSDRKKVRRASGRPGHRSFIPSYAGRWPFIGIAFPLDSFRDDPPPGMKERNRPELSGIASERVVSVIQRNPLTAIVVAAGVGLALALAFSEYDLQRTTDRT
jgi:hypothetical protein